MSVKISTEEAEYYSDVDGMNDLVDEVIDFEFEVS